MSDSDAADPHTVFWGALIYRQKKTTQNWELGNSKSNPWGKQDESTKDTEEEQGDRENDSGCSKIQKKEGNNKLC